MLLRIFATYSRRLSYSDDCGFISETKYFCDVTRGRLLNKVLSILDEK
jgi:hypothetical protein